MAPTAARTADRQVIENDRPPLIPRGGGRSLVPATKEATSMDGVWWLLAAVT